MIWKIYFWIISFLILVSIPVFLAETDGKVNTVDLANLALMASGAVGVYGYAFKRKLASKEFWLRFLIVSAVYQLAYSFFLDQKYGAGPATSTVEGLITFLPLIPMFIALALYVKRLERPPN